MACVGVVTQALCRQQLQKGEAGQREAQHRCDAQAALIEQLQGQVAVAAEEKAELLAFQQSTDALREKYQRMADLAVDMQRVAQETQVRQYVQIAAGGGPRVSGCRVAWCMHW